MYAQKTAYALLFLIALTAIVFLQGCSRRTLQEHQKTVSVEESGGLEPVLEAPAKKIKDLNFQEAESACRYYRSNGMVDQLKKVLERMITLSSDQRVIEPLLRELSDLSYTSQAFPEAEILYEQYALLYPGAADIDYFVYRLIKSTEQLVLSAGRDQTKVKKLVDRTDEFLTRFEKSFYASDVLAIRAKALCVLVASEVERVDFYLKRFLMTEKPSALLAARTRLMYIHEKLLPRLAEKAPGSLSDLLEAIVSEEFLNKNQQEQHVLLKRTLELALIFVQSTAQQGGYGYLIQTLW